MNEKLHRRYLHDAPFHALVHQIVQAVRANPNALSDIYDAAEVAREILSREDPDVRYVGGLKVRTIRAGTDAGDREGGGGNHE